MDLSLRQISSTGPVSLFQYEEKAATAQESSPSDSIYDIITHSLYLLFRSILGIFIRIITLPHTLVNTFAPHIMIKEEYKITPEKIAEKGFDEQFKRITEDGAPHEKLQYILNRTDELAKKMDIKKKIDVYITPNKMNLGSGGCSMTCSERLPLQLHVREALYSNEQLDFLIAHELADISNDHRFYESLYEIAVTVGIIAIGFFYSFWAIPILEGLFSALKIILHRKMEKRSDDTAIAHVGGDAAQSHVDYLIADAKKDRTAAADSENGTFLDSLIQKVMPLFVSTDGNQRLNHFTSNPLTERAKYISEISQKRSATNG